MEIFFTLLTVLILIAPAIAKAIEKSLMKAGMPDAAGRVRRIGEKIDGKDGIPERRHVLGEPFPDIVPTEVPPASSPAREQVHEAAPVVRQTAARALPEEGRPVINNMAGRRRAASPETSGPARKEGRHLDIDPKKLILYSEIMKPKF